MATKSQSHQPPFLRAHYARSEHTAVNAVNRWSLTLRAGEEGLPGSVTLMERGFLKQGQAGGPQMPAATVIPQQMCC